MPVGGAIMPGHASERSDRAERRKLLGARTLDLDVAHLGWGFRCGRAAAQAYSDRDRRPDGEHVL